MVYKIGNIKDLEALPPMDEGTKELLYHYAKVLSTEYGKERDIDRSDGGYILYVTSNATNEDVKAYFDYTRHRVECVERYGDICSAMYLLNNDFCVTILTMLENTPVEILSELDYKGELK